jgi:hypothetical protein
VGRHQPQAPGAGRAGSGQAQIGLHAGLAPADLFQIAPIIILKGVNGVVIDINPVAGPELGLKIVR